MKYLITILLLFSFYYADAQKFLPVEETYILEIDQKWYANIIQKRFDKAIASNYYFECTPHYCFEIDEDDMELRFGIFNRLVIPKRFKKNIAIIHIWPDIIDENGGEFYL